MEGRLDPRRQIPDCRRRIRQTFRARAEEDPTGGPVQAGKCCCIPPVDARIRSSIHERMTGGDERLRWRKEKRRTEKLENLKFSFLWVGIHLGITCQSFKFLHQPPPIRFLHTNILHLFLLHNRFTSSHIRTNVVKGF